MLSDWMRWLSSLHPDELWFVTVGLILIDAPRYAIGEVIMCLWDWMHECFAFLRPSTNDAKPLYCPTVCVVLAGYNEANTIEATLNSLWGTYPNMEIIVVDDGSIDGMIDVARAFAANHAGVLVLGRKRRSGKSSALNTALPFTTAEVVVSVDTDSHLAPMALWNIVQPLRDPKIGAVSATVRVRNPFVNLVTWLQTYEYLRTILLGRTIAARLGVLGIVSGAFGAFRREALMRIGGWDVGPGEDGDLTLRIRKIGYQIAFKSDAVCYSNVPATWRRLFNQRRRWDRAVVTFDCRKHVDMAYFWQPHFRWIEFLMLFERWFFNIACLYGLWGYLGWIYWSMPHHVLYVLFSIYICYVACEFFGAITLLYYSESPWRDLATCSIIPLAPLYQLFLKIASVVAVTEEIVFRQSFRDNFVPKHVRDVTWHW